MKISEISNLCNVPKETIRYYVSLGLLFPQRKGSSVIFTEREIADLRYIGRLKNMHFNLKEIQAITSIKKSFYSIEPSYFKEFKEILINKRHEVLSRITGLNNSVAAIDKELNEVDENSNIVTTETGVPIAALSILFCPCCCKPLSIQNANMTSQYIINGWLVCECGYRAEIKQGIIVTANKCMDSDDHPDVTRDLYRGLHPDFFKLYQQSYDLIADGLHSLPLHNKIIMEANVNGYFFLYNNFKNLPKNVLYIVIDKYPEMLFMYKSLLERLNLNFDILYIADAKVQYPIRLGSVDYLIDFFGNAQYQYYCHDSFIDDADKYLKNEAAVLGSYMNFDANAKSRLRIAQKYKRSSPRTHMFSALKSDYEHLNYDVTSNYVGSVFKTQDQCSFTCHVDGEEMRIYYYTAKRISRNK